MLRNLTHLAQEICLWNTSLHCIGLWLLMVAGHQGELKHCEVDTPITCVGQARSVGPTEIQHDS